MENHTPINSVNSEKDFETDADKLQNLYDSLHALRKDNERLRQNNVDLKLLVIEEKEKIQKIVEIIK